MKKLSVLFLAAVFCLSLVGCSKDAEINTFMAEFENVTNEMSKKIEDGDVDGAQTVFDGKKESLKSKWASLKDARGFQVSEATKKKMEDDFKKHGETLQKAVMKGTMKIATDQAKVTKMQNLMKEFMGILQM
ncbi:MAG TPA: hypothetical protein PKY59_17800 [Pyrinomonadaceae bacterium]|nr:hypothetical protein [Pyrinomonadaceae bacterium]